MALSVSIAVCTLSLRAERKHELKEAVDEVRIVRSVISRLVASRSTRYRNKSPPIPREY